MPIPPTDLNLFLGLTDIDILLRLAVKPHYLHATSQKPAARQLLIGWKPSGGLMWI